MKTCFVASGLLACAFAAGSTSAGAGEILTYVGNDFHVERAPYVAADRVTATIRLSRDLVSIMPKEVTPASFEISDGVQTIADANAFAPDTHFEFRTDAAGAIVEWDVRAVYSLNGVYGINEIHSGSLPQMAEDRGTMGTYPYGFTYAYVLDAPGAWSRTSTPDVPEPSTFTLSLVAAASAGLIVSHRRRRAFAFGA